MQQKSHHTASMNGPGAPATRASGLNKCTHLSRYSERTDLEGPPEASRDAGSYGMQAACKLTNREGNTPSLPPPPPI